jgi:hypothetical protein
MKKFLLQILIIIFNVAGFINGDVLKSYNLRRDPIDVVIPCHEKDLTTLNLVIDGIRKNGKNIRNIIVISAKKLTDNAQWFDENRFPFSKADISKIVFNDDKSDKAYKRIGWIYQQLLKLYSLFVIPNISTNALMLDADTIFFNPVEFMDQYGNPLFNVSPAYHPSYFSHAFKLISPFPITRIHPWHSGITNHMLFQLDIMKDLFDSIYATHKIEPWKAILQCIDKPVDESCLSEYEIYFNFVFSRTNQAKIRLLKWDDEAVFGKESLDYYKNKGYHYVTFHDWML